MKKNIFSGLHSFLLLWGSQTVSALGTAMTSYALIIWVYKQQGTASSLTLLTICTFLPTIFFRFIAGAIADRWDKKKLMLLSDFIAACGTGVMLLLFSYSALQVWHIYAINFLLSLMNAFQNPASFTAVSLLVPREQYMRVSGLQSFGGSAVSIMAPALGSVILAFGGMKLVLLIDLVSFAFAFVTLLAFIKIPKLPNAQSDMRESFVQSCLFGVRYLREHTALLRIILFFAVINFLAKLGGDGMMPAFILGRTGGNQQSLGIVQTAVALGIMVGGLLVTLLKPAKNKTNVIFLCCATTFICTLVLSLLPSLSLWTVVAFASYIPVAVLGANLNTIMRAQVPIEMQGRVFSAQGTLQNMTIPIGLYLGGVLADLVFEPFMLNVSPLQAALSHVFGTGKGSGISLMFALVGIVGCSLSLLAIRDPIYRILNQEPSNASPHE